MKLLKSFYIRPKAITIGLSSSKWRLAQYLERRWWQQYLRNKSPENYLKNKKAYWSKVLSELGHQIVEGDQALDAGCGPAGVFILLHKQQQLTALDPLLDHYAADLPVFDKLAYPKVNFVTAALETAHLPLASFDVIYCFNAINHVEDWELALDQLSSWAKPGATLLLSSDVHRHAFLYPIFKALPGDMLHPQQHRVEAYRAALQSRGWRIEREVLIKQELIFNYTAWVAVFDGPA